MRGRKGQDGYSCGHAFGLARVVTGQDYADLIVCFSVENLLKA